jgi:hypothetical protein
MDRIATAEDIQSELRTLWAMTEEPTPSREKIAAALNSLSERVAKDRIDFLIEVQDALKGSDSAGLKAALKTHDGVAAATCLIEAMRVTATNASAVSKLLGRLKR